MHPIHDHSTHSSNMDPFEVATLISYVRSLLANLQPTGRAFGKLYEWGSEHANLIHLPAPQLDEDATIEDKWRALTRVMEVAHEEVAAAAPSRLQQNLRLVSTMTDLDPIEAAMLGIFVRYVLYLPCEDLFDKLREAIGTRRYLFAEPALIAPLLGVSEGEVYDRLRGNARLPSSGLLRIDQQGMIRLQERLLSLLTIEVLDEGLAVERLLGQPVFTHIQWEDYLHLVEERDHVARILEGALNCDEKGVNILLYGPAGTGKTEFCKALAKRVEALIYPVGEADDWEGQPTVDERLAALRLGQRILRTRPQTLLLFDEMEDLFTSDDFRGSRVYFLRALEENRVPVLWTANDVDDLPAPVVRRMTYALELTVPPLHARSHVWQRELERTGLHVSEADATALANDFEAAPALIASASRSARLSGGGVADVRRAVASIDRAVRGGMSPAPAMSLSANFDLSLANADTDLEKLADRLAQSGANKAFSLLLSGPPGTGKSQYVRYLARRMGLPLVQRRGSDLLSKWQGESEKAISRAFQEAREGPAMLIFDEVDSLLSTRGAESKSWELSQINELLQCMELHPAPFAATTNLVDNLDPASMRRFTFKIRFDYLTLEQAKQAWLRHFKREAPLGLERYVSLTPADFAVVEHKARVLNVSSSDDELLELLEVETSHKRHASQRIGFRS